LNYSNDGQYLAFGGKKTRNLFVYSREKQTTIKKVRIQANDILFDNQSKHVYAAGQRGNIKRVPVGKSFLKSKFNISANHSWNSFHSIALNDDYFIAANQDNLIYLYNRNSGAREEILRAHTNEVWH